MGGLGRTHLKTQLEVLRKKARNDKYVLYMSAFAINVGIILSFLAMFPQFKEHGAPIMCVAFFFIYYEAKLLRKFCDWKDPFACIYLGTWEKVKSHLMQDADTLSPGDHGRITGILKDAKKLADDSGYPYFFTLNA